MRRRLLTDNIHFRLPPCSYAMLRIIRADLLSALCCHHWQISLLKKTTTTACARHPATWLATARSCPWWRYRAKRPPNTWPRSSTNQNSTLGKTWARFQIKLHSTVWTVEHSGKRRKGHTLNKTGLSNEMLWHTLTILSIGNTYTS